jgi:hypothetical protein
MQTAQTGIYFGRRANQELIRMEEWFVAKVGVVQGKRRKKAAGAPQEKRRIGDKLPQAGFAAALPPP